MLQAETAKSPERAGLSALAVRGVSKRFGGLAAVWDVSDAATPELMDTMYAGMRAGQDPPNALRAAKLKLVRGKGAYSKPRFWAPFVIYSGM